MASWCSSALAGSSRTRASALLRQRPARATLLPRISRSYASTDASAPPDISKIVDDISRLTLLQAADLVSLLKSRLNIQDIAMPVAAAPAAAAPVEEEPAEEEKPKEKTVFSLKIESFDPTAKAKIIREVKAQVPNLNLMEAKKFVESVPKVVRENMNKEDAEKLKALFEGLGAVVVLE